MGSTSPVIIAIEDNFKYAWEACRLLGGEIPLPLDLDDLEASYGRVKSTLLQCSYYWIPINK